MPAAGSTILTHVRQDEVLTGEAVALDVQPVGFFLRALGALIDAVIGILLAVVFVLLLTIMVGAGIVGEDVMGIAVITTLVLVTVIVPTAVETATRGRSIGKLIVGGRIVRADGGATGFRQSLIRALVGVLEIYFTLGAIAMMVGIFTPRSQRLGDLVAGTYSERTRTAALPPTPPGLPEGLEAWASIADVGRLPDRLARRIAQFAQQAGAMAPEARTRIAHELATEALPHVSPAPPVDPETQLRAIVAVRRAREERALALQNARVDALAAGATGVPRGFPDR